MQLPSTPVSLLSALMLWSSLHVLPVSLFSADPTSQDYVVDRFSEQIESNGIPKGWKSLEFKKIPRHTQYAVMENNKNFFVKAVSKNSASGILKEVQINPKDYPILSWSWKVEHVLEKADAAKKTGDDYASRIYVAFKYDPKNANAWEKTKYGSAKLLYGQYPPKSALNYVWDNKLPIGTSLNNAYTDKTKMIVVESGNEKSGQWVPESRNIYEDYLKLFGSEPPEIEFIAIMTDTDNTGESAAACYDDIVLKKKNKILSERTLELSEKLTFQLPSGTKNVRVWIPLPSNDSHQQTEIIKVVSPYPYRMEKDKDFGNRLIYIESNSPDVYSNLDFSILYKIVRKEQRGSKQAEKYEPPLMNPSNYLQPRGLERINEKIQKIAIDITRNVQNPLEKTKALYQYVLTHMKYDKSGTQWGRGDSIYACDVGKGNCTDFHSLFIALSRASGIPAVFRMGIPLPETSEGEPAGSYHCWAEFYIKGKGWIPVDVSEAWKNPEKAEYFFGNLDVNRVLLTTGREILLSPQQKSAPLNYFSKPYIELDGQPLNDFKLERRFKNI